MYRDRTLPRLRNVQGQNITKVKECTGTEHYQGLLYTYCTLTVHNWFCVHLYSKLVLCTLHWQLKDERWNSVLGTDNQTNKNSNICTSRAASSQLKNIISFSFRSPTTALIISMEENIPYHRHYWYDCLLCISTSLSQNSKSRFRVLKVNQCQIQICYQEFRLKLSM